MKRIFLVEDDVSLGQSLFERLGQTYEVVWEKSFAGALKKMSLLKSCHLAVLDVGLPDGNGFELAKLIRQQSNIPFLFLTAQADAESRLEGYQLGAEEYIPKPFHLKELLLRLNHVLELHSGNDVLKVGDIEIRFSECQIIALGSDKTPDKIAVPASEMRVLEILVRQSPKVIDRDMIMTEVWGLESDLSHRSIDNIVVKLRTYLRGESSRIKTVRGRGYQWLDERES